MLRSWLAAFRKWLRTSAGLYVSLGVPLENALVALLAYRILFYFIPFGLSMALCGPLLREVADSAEPV